MKFLFLCLFCFPFLLEAQTLPIKIVDSLTNDPLPYATIYFKKSGIGASTRPDGTTEISTVNIPEMDTLVISYVGYRTKSIGILKNKTQSVNIRLVPADNTLEEIIVRYVAPPKPKKIIRRALKNTAENYANQDVIFKALFRSTVKENGTFIKLDEAILKTYYSEYPQKKMDRKIWEDWYDDKEYAFDIAGKQAIGPYLFDFNTKKDQQTVLASRRSDNLTRHDISFNLREDPMILLGFDKIKYRYDFLNPFLLRKYNYRHEPSENMDGMPCYVISFYPKQSRRKFIQDFSKKNKSPIYIGKLYITKEKNILVKCVYKLAVERDFGFFASGVPLDYQVELNYKKFGAFYAVNKIIFSETRSMGKDDQGAAVIHESTQEYHVLEIETQTVLPLPDSTIFRSSRQSSLRYYNRNYNPDYWNTLQLPKHLKLPKKLVADLEIKTPLTQQFKRNEKEEKKDLAIPTAPREYFAFDYHDTKLVDSLHWMALPENEAKLKKYLTAENKYARNELVEDKDYQKTFFNEVINFYPSTTRTDRKIKPGTFYGDYDSLNQRIYYYQIDSFRNEPVLNISSFLEKYPKAYLNKIVPNPSKNRIMVVYQKPGIIGDFVSVLGYGNDEEISNFSKVYSAAWFSDDIVLYAKTGTTARAGELWYHQIGSQTDKLLFTESDHSFDIALNRKETHLFCTIQSQTENEIYRVLAEDDLPVLELMRARKMGTTNEIKVLDRYYVLVNTEKTGSRIQHADFAQPNQLTDLVRADRGDYILDFIPGKNRIVTLTYERSVPKLKFVNTGEKQWREIPINLGIGQYTLLEEQPDSNSLRFHFSSPSHAGTIYSYNFIDKKLSKISAVIPKKPTYLNNVKTERIWAKNSDGTKVPITIMRDRASGEGYQGLILKTYGAYGAITTPGVSEEEAFLLRRGYFIAYAHVRGEGILGPDWFRAGRATNKKNAIADYLACAKHLIKKELATSNTLIGYGNSAGALIVAAAINQRPDLFKSVILDHPYLDVVNTIMNDTLPLTVDHYRESGNPQDKKVYDYILSYSPYQNIKKQKYPNVLLIAGYLDYQTPIWQVAKYAAKLRANDLSGAKILFMTDMNSGHIGSTSGNDWIKTISDTGSFMRMGRSK